MSVKGIVAGGIAGLILLTGGITFGARSFTTVPAGNVQVLETFGKVNHREVPSGIHGKNPLSGRHNFTIKSQELEEIMTVPTNEGLVPQLDVSIIYKIDPEKASNIYETIGEGYKEIIVIPYFRSAVRDIVSKYGSQDLYKTTMQQGRGEITQDIFNKLAPEYAERGIILEEVLLRGLELPDTVRTAIETKIENKQKAEQMEYILDKEKSEAERKRIEAQGIADAQSIISESLTDEYLQWRYITTLETLANSPNTTVLITPYDSGLIPGITGNSGSGVTGGITPTIQVEDLTK